VSNAGGGESTPQDWRPPPEWAPPSASAEEVAPPLPTPIPPDAAATAPVPAPAPPASPGFIPAAPAAGFGVPYGIAYPTAIVELQPTTRKVLVWETRFVMLAFLLPGIAGAVVLLAQHVNGVGTVTRFPVLLPDNPVGNLLVGIFAYLPVAVMVPLALHLLWRTGQTPRMLGLVRPTLRYDIWPAIGLMGASFGSEAVLILFLTPLLAHHPALVSNTAVGHVPDYYVIYGIAISITTAIAEEVLVSGYLLTRLEQLGWSPRRALILSLILRTSYHVYYGVGFILTVPFGYFVTRSFQKNRRLTRPIAAHFLWDAILITIAVLT
jgi:membrane protease YdiL (CAAX protease family)